MALTTEGSNGNGMVMPVQPMNSGNYGYGVPYAVPFSNGFGNGFGGGFGFDSSWIILFLFAMMFGGFGGGWGMGGFGGMWGMDGMFPWLLASNANNQNSTQDGFNQIATANTLSGIQSAVTSGFGDTQLGIAGVNQNICQTGANITNAVNQGFAGVNQNMSNGFSGVQTSLCNGFNGVNQTVSNGFAQAEISANNRQMANMQQNYTNQLANVQAMNGIQNGIQNCCCQTQSGIDNLRYTVATEACADRAAVGDALQAVTAQGVANTNALMNTITGGIQSIKDQLCQDKIDAKNETIQNLRDQLTFANLQASQTAQTSRLLADNAAQTQAVENYIRPQINPAYVVPNPYACYYSNNTGCCNG